jgi:hypothetical protein
MVVLGVLVLALIVVGLVLYFRKNKKSQWEMY